MPCRGGAAEGSRGPDRLSSTMRTFASSGHRRRRPVSTISRRLMARVSVRISIPTVSYIPPNSARRPTPDEYTRTDLVLQKYARKDPTKLNYMHLTVSDIRKVADEFSGYETYGPRMYL